MAPPPKTYTYNGCDRDIFRASDRAPAPSWACSL